MEWQQLLDVYGLTAIALLMLVKSVGVPVPIPADLLMVAAAARAARGQEGLGQAFLAILLAMTAGSLVQFQLVRGPGRGLLYRIGPKIGLTATRLDRAAGMVRRGGVGAVVMAIVTPGASIASVAACGLAALPLGTFIPGLVIGSAAFLGLHFLVGYGGVAAAGLLPPNAGPWLLIGAAVLAVAGLAAWVAIRRRHRTHMTGQTVVEALAAWQEATCPICLTLGTLETGRHAPAPQPEPGNAPS